MPLIRYMSISGLYNSLSSQTGDHMDALRDPPQWRSTLRDRISTTTTLDVVPGPLYRWIIETSINLCSPGSQAAEVWSGLPTFRLSFLVQLFRLPYQLNSTVRGVSMISRICSEQQTCQPQRVTQQHPDLSWRTNDQRHHICAPSACSVHKKSLTGYRCRNMSSFGIPGAASAGVMPRPPYLKLPARTAIVCSARPFMTRCNTCTLPTRNTCQR